MSRPARAPGRLTRHPTGSEASASIQSRERPVGGIGMQRMIEQAFYGYDLVGWCRSAPLGPRSIGVMVACLSRFWLVVRSTAEYFYGLM